MFNPTKLELKPSISVATVLAIPCIATLILIISVQLPIAFVLPLVCVHLFLSYRFISTVALLSLPRSIQAIQIENQQIYLVDKGNQRFLAQPVGKSIIHPLFTFLSFECEHLTAPLTIQKSLQNSPALGAEESNEIIDITDNGEIVSNIHSSKTASLLSYFRNRFHGKNTRHLIICKYNALNSSAFRRLRVWLKFNQ